MALEKYLDVYTAEKYAERVNEIKEAAQTLINDGYFDSVKAKVYSQIDILKKNEMLIYNMLNLEDKSIAGLNKRLDEYKQAVINLSGPQLNAEIIYALNEDREERYEYYKARVEQIVSQYLNDLTNSGYIVNDENFKDTILRFLEQEVAQIDGGKRHFSSPKGIITATNKVIYVSLTNEQKRAWRKIIDKIDEKANDGSIAITQQNDNTVVTFNWLNVTENLKPNEAKNLDKTKVDKINQIITDKILSLVPQDQELIKRIINEKILAKNNFAFFVGNNINEIVGILGEIQGIYYLAKLTGGLDNIQWRGGVVQSRSGKQPPVDIALKGLGIQVKNSINEELHSINFANATINTILDKVGLSAEARNLILNYYGTLTFNVPYNYNNENKKYIEVGSPQESLESKNKTIYVNSYEKLVEANNDINSLLSLYASTFMYMNTNEFGGKINTNTLYLLSGTIFVAASEILSKILTEIETQEKSFSMRAKYTDKTNPKNIVSALNQKTKNPNYSQSIIGNIILTSSFNFGNLIKT